MNWLLAVIIGHLLNALGFILNKAALNVSVKNAGAFTFYVGLLGLISFAFLPFGFVIPAGEQWVPVIIGGVFFMLALLFFVYALTFADASRVAPFIGALSPIATFVLEYYFLHTQFRPAFIVAFIFLVGGTAIVTIDVDAKKLTKEQLKAEGVRRYYPWILGALAAVSFAASFVASKVAFDILPFWGAFAWMRGIAFLSVLALLVVPNIRRETWKSRTIFYTRDGLIYLASQAVGAAAFIFISIAIAQVSVSLVNALQGIQYAFLIILVLIGNIVAPRLVKEVMSKKSLALRSVGVIIIGIGIAIISLSQ